MRVLAALLAIFLNLWALFFGFRDLSTWLRARFGGPYHLADLEWTTSGLLLLGWFAAAVAISVYPVVKPKSSAGVLVLPILIGLGGLNAVQSSTWLVYGPQGVARNRVAGNAERFQAYVRTWIDTHATFPASDAELQEVFRQLHTEPSPYAHQGAPLPYRAVFVGIAKGPVQQPTFPEPGVLYYAISAAGDHFWITLSVLDAPSSEKAVILREGRVFEGQAPEKPKSEEPKPEGPKPEGPKQQVDALPSGKKPEAR